MRLHLALPALLALCLTLGPARAASPAEGATGEWRAARWGMTVDEVLRAFPGEATRLEPEQRLADGNTISAGIERHELGGQAFRVRFVFEGGKLALVSLVAGHEKFVGAEVFEALGKVLAERFGEPGTATRDDAFIDMRQVRWDRPRGRVDLKFIPGKIVILHSRPEPPGKGS
ncbi:MAG: hypothetical protein HZB56_21090 [Deltaproteobacteria bacterium]|nr:hypothetical protein [Deltaproteobacteria bacterium]